MNNMSNVQRRLITSMIAIVLLLITIVGITYAYFISRVVGNTNPDSASVSAGRLELTYKDGNGLIELLKIKPGTTLETKTFTVKNTGTGNIEYYDVILENVINELSNYEDLTYNLTCTSTSGTCNGTNGVFPTSNTRVVTNSIDVGVTHTYSLTVTYNETNTDQSDDMNKTISAKVNIVDNKKLLIYGNSIQNGTPTPDNPIEIQSVGDLVTDSQDEHYREYKIPVNVKTKNILVLEDIYECSYSGDYYPSAARLNNGLTSPHTESSTYKGCYWLIKVKPNTTYTFSTDMRSDNATIYSKGAMYDSLEEVQKYGTVPVSKQIRGATFTTDSTTQYVLIGKDNHDASAITLTWTWAQLEEGSTATPYVKHYDETTNIYLNEPLRKIGDYVDYIDFRNGKVVRNVEVIDDTGTLPIEQSLRGLENPIEESIDVPSVLIGQDDSVSVGTTVYPSEITVK